jgi:hypothetical protein
MGFEKSLLRLPHPEVWGLGDGTKQCGLRREKEADDGEPQANWEREGL